MADNKTTLSAQERQERQLRAFMDLESAVCALANMAKIAYDITHECVAEENHDKDAIFIVSHLEDMILKFQKDYYWAWKGAEPGKEPDDAAA
jgi:hypothetical protein